MQKVGSDNSEVVTKIGLGFGGHNIGCFRNWQDGGAEKLVATPKLQFLLSKRCNEK